MLGVETPFHVPVGFVPLTPVLGVPLFMVPLVVFSVPLVVVLPLFHVPFVVELVLFMVPLVVVPFTGFVVVGVVDVGCVLVGEVDTGCVLVG